MDDLIDDEMMVMEKRKREWTQLINAALSICDVHELPDPGSHVEADREVYDHVEADHVLIPRRQEGSAHS